MEQTASSFGATWRPLSPANLQAGLPFLNLIDDAVVLFFSIIAHTILLKLQRRLSLPNAQISIMDSAGWIKYQSWAICF
jgi:hypothetical protein